MGGVLESNAWKTGELTSCAPEFCVSTCEVPNDAWFGSQPSGLLAANKRAKNSGNLQRQDKVIA